MVYQTLDQINTTSGFHTVFIYANDVTGGILMPLFLFAFFVIVMLSNYFMQKRMVGDGNFPIAFTVAGFATFGLSILMFIIPNLINPFVPLFSMAISIIGLLWIMFNRE